MNNLCICVLTCSKEKKRLKNFLKFGILNKKEKVKIIFLSDEEKPTFVKLECEWKNYKETHYSLRFVKYLIEEKNDSNWYLQVDDDSSTDVESFLETIKNNYDHADPIMLKTPTLTQYEEKATFASTSIEEGLNKTLKDLDFKLSDNEFDHTWEITGLSYGGVEKIKKYKKNKDFLKICQENKTTFSDQVPFGFAKVSKIPIVDFFKFSPFPISEEFTALNEKGRYCHIHYIMEEWDEYENFKYLIENKIKINDCEKLKEKIKNKNLKKTFWEVWQKEQKQKFYVFLDENNILKIQKTNEFLIWNLFNDIIEISNKNNEKIKLIKITDNYFENEIYSFKKINFIEAIGRKIKNYF